VATSMASAARAGLAAIMGAINQQRPVAMAVQYPLRPR
ncbi:MAG: hypothetical protein QOK41_466, partial [Sphingomonadales bacterium]|nr:hypothetical protein [Sphingomonadales bacterium]